MTTKSYFYVFDFELKETLLVNFILFVILMKSKFVRKIKYKFNNFYLLLIKVFLFYKYRNKITFIFTKTSKYCIRNLLILFNII